MYRSPTHLWLLPDLGTDSRLLAPQITYFSDVALPPSADYKTCATVADYAVRTADRWLSEKSSETPTNKSFFIGGIGFGGILALELARELASRSICPAGVLLVGSVRSKANIPSSLRLTLSLLGCLPVAMGRWRLTSMFQKIASSETMNPNQTRLLQEMAREADWPLVRWQSQAMIGWNRNRAEFEASGFPIFQLHGRGDRRFRVPSAEDATLLIHGKQLINLSLAAEVNRWIESILRDHDLRKSQNQPT